MIYLYLKDSTFTAVKFQTSYVKGVPFVQQKVYERVLLQEVVSPGQTLHCKGREPSANNRLLL